VYKNYHQVVSSDNVNAFKKRLDKIRFNQDMVYDYKSDITRIGNSSLTSLDDASVL